MAALCLHHSIFANEKEPGFQLYSASPFLRPVSGRDGSPTSQLLSSTAYQDLIQRQPIHPGGPTSGWDLGLNLFGDPVTPAERKTLIDRQTKMKLRRLHAINVAFELLFGIWGTYTTIRYFLTFTDGSGDAKYVCALAFGTASALAVALVTISAFMPLFPQRSCSRTWRSTRSLLRACYLFLLFAGAVVNLVLVALWHPDQLCHWDLDIVWSLNAITSSCHMAPFTAWIAAAVVRLIVTSMIVLSFIYTLRSYNATRHPNSKGNNVKYSPYLPSDTEDVSPVSASSPHCLSKSTFRLTRSEESARTLNQSHTTLPKYNSISTLALSTSCTGHSRSHSSPSSKDISPQRISPPTSRRASAHATTHGPSTQSASEVPPQTQSASSSTTPSLRRTSRVSLTQTTSDTASYDTIPQPERLTGRDSCEIRSCASWKPGHRGAGVHHDVKKTTLAWDNAHVRRASQTAGVGPESHGEGESVGETDKNEDVPMYTYGYGASGLTYPYLDTYNPPRPSSFTETSSSCTESDEHGHGRRYGGYRRLAPSGPAKPDISVSAPSDWEPQSSPSMEEDGASDGEEEEEEYVAMMGGFVRRMATIESLGSREATGTLSTTCSGSVARPSVRTGPRSRSRSRSSSGTPGSQFSSVQFANHGSCASSSSTGGSESGSGLGSGSGSGSGSGWGLSECSLSTAYLSFSSGRTGMMRVSERGELLPPHVATSAASSRTEREYYTASGSSFPRMDDEGSMVTNAS